MQSVQETQKKPNNIFETIQDQPDRVLFWSSTSLSIWLIFLWITQHIDYFPNWAPLPATTNPIIDFFQFFWPIIFCVAGTPTILIFIVLSSTLVKVLIDDAKNHRTRSRNFLYSGLLILSVPVLLWALGEKIDQALLNYGLSRYDVVIGSIESYKNEHGEYPSNLEILETNYLSENQGIYFKFGRELAYEPKPPIFFEYVPFTFEIQGQHHGFSGQSLMYCPIKTCSIRSGEDFSAIRINDRWVWVYLSPL